MKHYLSVGAIFKDEAPYLKEWLDHYIKREVDHFYLIDDGSTDNFRDIIAPYEDKITLFDLASTPIVPLPEGAPYVPGGRIPTSYYNCFSPIKNETEWMLICDIDEYVWSPLSLSMKKQLKSLDGIYNYITVKGPNFGSNGHKQQPSEIVNSFTKRQQLPINDSYDKNSNINMVYKTLVKTDIVKFFGIHNHIVNKGKTRQLVIPNFFTLNHYMIQSEQKWENNLNKTNACPAQYKKGSRRTMEEFYRKDKDYSQVEDVSLINQNLLNT